MDLILVVDRPLSRREAAALGRPARASVLALSSDPAVAEGARRALEAAGARAEVLDAASLVQAEAAEVRRGVAAWSARVGRAKAGGASVRSRLLRPGSGASGWWYSLLAEKNTLKTDAFLRAAQLRAAKAAAAGRPVLFAVSDRTLSDSLEMLPGAVRLGARPRGTPRPVRVLQALKLWAVAAGRGVVARAAMGPRGRRRPGAGALLLACYFPACDEAAAARGEFRSRYAGPLHGLLAERRVPHAWLLTTVSLDGKPWSAAAGVARRLARAGEKLFLIEEFLSLSEAFEVLIRWMSLAGEASSFRGDVDPAAVASGPFPPEAEPIVRALWDRSFLGAPLMEGLLAAARYRAAFEEFAGARACVFWSEGHGWERALVAEARARGLRTAGFQHGSLLGNFFNYFPDPSELREAGRDALPRPDLYAANGEEPRALLAAAGWDGVLRAEALRYMSLRDALAAPVPARPEKPTLLVAGSIDAGDTRALAALAAAAFPPGSGVRLVFKGHPAQPFGPHLRASGLDAAEAGPGPLAAALGACNAVLTGSSGAAIEALAYGRPVLVPLRADALDMSPLSDFPEHRRAVRGPEDLREAFAEASLQLPGRRDAGRAFVARYWDLDSELPGWRRLLDALLP